MVADENPPSPRKWLTYGSLMALIGSGLFFALNPLFNMAIKSQLNLDPKGVIFPNWIVAPIPVTYKFYIMNVDNPSETLRGEKLRVSEKGPFTFKQWRRKEIIRWAADKSTVTYYEYKKYEFDEERTVGSLDDKVTTINPLVATFGATISKLLKEDLPLPMVLSPFVYGTINGLFAIHREGLFVTQKVREFLFGKRNRMLDTITTLMKPLDFLGIQLDMLPKAALPLNNTVGLLFGKNNTPEGPYEVYSGLTNDGDPFQFASWQGKKKLKWWKSEECNMINGSDGSFFKPGMKLTDILYAFGPDLCRSISLQFVKESEYKGIPTYQYSLADDFLLGIDKKPWNDCFCMHKDKNKCRIDGMYDLGGCQFGAPLVLTYPHFLNYPHLQRLVDGLNPREEDHGTVLQVQPALGGAIHGLKRLMFAVRVERNPRIRAFGEIQSVYVPFVWIEESAGLDEKMAAQMRNTLVYPLRGASITTAGIGIGGVAVILIAFARIHLRSKQKSDSGYGASIYDNESKKRSLTPKNSGDQRIDMSDKIRAAYLNIDGSKRESFEKNMSNGNVKHSDSGNTLGIFETLYTNSSSQTSEVYAENDVENKTVMQSRQHSHSSNVDSENNLPPLENTHSDLESEQGAFSCTSPKKVH